MRLFVNADSFSFVGPALQLVSDSSSLLAIADGCMMYSCLREFNTDLGLEVSLMEHLVEDSCRDLNAGFNYKNHLLELLER